MPQIKASDIKSGMHIKVFQRIKEGEKERVQAYEGLCITRRGGNTVDATITVRKKSGNVFVEKIFPIHLPTIEKVELIKTIPTRRKKLTFVRNKKYKPKKKATMVTEFVATKAKASEETAA